MIAVHEGRPTSCRSVARSQPTRACGRWSAGSPPAGRPERTQIRTITRSRATSAEGRRHHHAEPERRQRLTQPHRSFDPCPPHQGEDADQPTEADQRHHEHHADPVVLGTLSACRAMPPANIASAVRTQARKVRSLASEKRGSGSSPSSYTQRGCRVVTASSCRIDGAPGRVGRRPAAANGKFLIRPGRRVQEPGGTVSRRGQWHVTCAVACGLVGALLPVVTGNAVANSLSARAPASVSVDVPALLSADGLRAVLPAGGSVAYRLPTLPDGGVRVLGDWNGDGVETPGIFDDGHWQLWNQVQRANDPAVTTTFGQPGDRPGHRRLERRRHHRPRRRPRIGVDPRGRSRDERRDPRRCGVT